MIVLSVDPGAHAGQAFWRDGLLRAVSDDLDADRCDVIVCEMPFIYPQRKTRADPNDMIVLAVRVGRLLERYSEADAVTPWPVQWNGGAKKAWTEIRVWEALDPRERDVLRMATSLVAKGYQNNLIDAVGIGLWYLTDRGYR